MIALVSFPRSGNTFFRNVLHDVYGLPSSTFHREPGRDLDENWASFPVIKTHLLPADLPPEMTDLKVVYLVRDGRDALVSLAHHRKDIVEPGTDFYNNLLEAILSPGGSNFGGWSQNVQAWMERADLVIRFEDLIEDPIRQTERLRGIIDLPPADPNKLPTFQQLKHGQPTYGAGSGNHFNPSITVKNFRRGKTGAWRDEMPDDLQLLFWRVHRPMMESLGYTEGLKIPNEQPRRFLVEAAKAFSVDSDGVNRYTNDLLNHFAQLIPYFPAWQIDLIYGQNIVALEDSVFGVKPDAGMGYETGLLALKSLVKNALPKQIYEPIAHIYRRGPYREMLSRLRVKMQGRKKYQAQLAQTAAQVNSYDLVHVTLPQHMSQVPLTNENYLVTIHDLTHEIFPEYHHARNINFSAEGMKISEEKAAHYLTISDATTKDLHRLYNVTSERITRIYEGASGKFNRSYSQELPLMIRQRYQLPNTGRYLMTLSTVEPRKNLDRVIEAFLQWRTQATETDVFLCIAGKKGWLSDDLYNKEKALRKKGVYFTGFVDDADLPQLLHSAEALCYVSHYEGFGLPILEAMQCGTPVIYGNNSSQPEVAGDAGIGVDSRSVKEITGAMQRILTDVALRQALSTKAWQQARTFSCLKMAYQTLLLYNKLAGEQN